MTRGFDEARTPLAGEGAKLGRSGRRRVLVSIDVVERAVVRVEEDVERHVVVAAVVHRARRDVGYVVERVEIVGQQVAARAAPAADAAQTAQRSPVGAEQSAVRVVVGHEEGVVLEDPGERLDVVHRQA